MTKNTKMSVETFLLPLFNLLLAMEKYSHLRMSYIQQ